MMNSTQLKSEYARKIEDVMKNIKNMKIIFKIL